ncbi:hypothetical protein FHS19_001730 [Paenibacillus rhizosphaerae]|uniref:Uncharacterized protein n=1 Tax=Paenibacillus rhizosphaerae TaxID=297318 RepID=A0A839TJV9_9BACL|nr:hypothetical protein [Paenibacillus rhizosphaerae]MBB3127076.1 hypothetical protein [Paenibacillus rhizosphaerae]
MEKRGPITAEDTALVKRYLIVPMILDAFERDKQIIESGLLKSPTLYTDLIDKAMEQATKELTYVRRAFKEHGIKVYDERKTRKGVEAKYLCRGYHKEMSMLWTFISAEATVLRRLFLGLNIETIVDRNIPEAMRQVPKLFYQEKTNS